MTFTTNDDQEYERGTQTRTKYYFLLMYLVTSANLNFRVCQEGCKFFTIFSKLIFIDCNLSKFIKTEEN